MEAVKQIITFLDKHSGSLTVLITVVYVVATILICRANYKAANASQRQVDEMQQQYRKSNRPYITCEYILKNRLFCGISICNHGNMVAKDLTFSIRQEFVDSLHPNRFFDFGKLNNSHYRLVGIGQKFDFFFSDVNHKPSVPFEMTIQYQSETDNFSESFCLDLSKQLPVYSVEEMEEKSLEISKKQQECLNIIADSLQLIANNYYQNSMDTKTTSYYTNEEID